MGWLRQGNKMIAPGIERVDTVKTEDGYEMKSIWCRSDLSDTSMMKLSLQQDIFTDMYRIWKLVCGSISCLILRQARLYLPWIFLTNRDTITWLSVCMPDSGNSLYCPTGYLELLRLQDRFVYLPEMPYRKVDLDQAMRNVLSQEEICGRRWTGRCGRMAEHDHS